MRRYKDKTVQKYLLSLHLQGNKKMNPWRQKVKHKQNIYSALYTEDTKYVCIIIFIHGFHRLFTIWTDHTALVPNA